MGLQITWYIIIAFFWTGFFILEGFDLGVGVLHGVVGKTNLERRVAINSIGPYWDGNEVWLVVAAAATFAAFPSWYASMFSALYLALMLVILALIARGVSFEYRGKVASPRWRAIWDWSLTIGSALLPVLLGVALGDLLAGLPINQNGDFTGSFLDLLTPYGLWVGVTLLALTLAHGAMFLNLKTTGVVQERARRLAGPLSWIAVPAVLGFAIWTHLQSSSGVAPGPVEVERVPARGRRSLGHKRRPPGLGLRRDHGGHRGHGRGHVRAPLPERHGLEHQQRLQPHRQEQRVEPLRPHRDDRGGGRLHPARARLPGLELPRLSRPYQGARRPGHARSPAVNGR